MSNWHDLFEYRDGDLFWRHRPREHFRSDRGWRTANTQFAGKRVGHTSDIGYRKVLTSGKIYSVSRIIYEMFYGEVPEQVDHINGNTLDNRIENLRAATPAENRQNAKLRCDNACGTRGVTKNHSGWRVQINKNSKIAFNKTFPDFELACLVAEEARRHYHGAFFSQRT